MAVLCRGAAEWTNLLGRIIAAVRDEDVREGGARSTRLETDPDATRAVRLACVVGSDTSQEHRGQRDKAEQEVTGIIHARNFEA